MTHNDNCLISAHFLHRLVEYQFCKNVFWDKISIAVAIFFETNRSPFLSNYYHFYCYYWYSQENLWFDELLQHLVQCTDSTLHSLDKIKKKTIVWKSLWGSGSGYIFFHASLPPSPGAFMMRYAMQSQTRIETRNVIDFNLISPCIANRWVWMMERVGRRRGFWKGERESANKFLCKIPNFAFDCPDQCGIGKQFAFVKNIFANKYILLQINIATIRIIFVS